MAFIPGNTGTASSFPDGFTGSSLANVETITATKVLTSADRRTQILTPSGALRIAQLPATAIIGEAWSFVCATGSAFSLQINASNGTVIMTLAPGESTWLNALTATPTDAANWALQIPSTVLSNGTVSTPALRFTGSGSDTGIYSPSTDAIAFSNAGVQTLLVSAAGAVTLGVANSAVAHKMNGLVLLDGKQTTSDWAAILGSSSGDDTTRSVFFSSGHAQVGGGTKGRINYHLLGRNVDWVIGNTEDGSNSRFTVGSSSAADLAKGLITNNFMNCTSTGAWTLGPSSGTAHTINGNTSVVLDTANTSYLAASDVATIRIGSSGTTPVLNIYSAANTPNFIMGSCSAANDIGTNAMLNFDARRRTNATTGASVVTRPLFKFTNNDLVVGETSAAGAWTLGAVSGSQTHTVKGTLNIHTTANTSQFAVNPNSGTGWSVGGAVISSSVGTHFIKWNSGTGIISYDSSSRLVKSDIAACPYGIAEVMQLVPRIYKRTDSDNCTEVGFIADEVMTVVPEVVSTGPLSLFTRNEEDTEIVPATVDYGRLTPVLVKAIQELNDKIEALEARLDSNP